MRISGPVLELMNVFTNALLVFALANKCKWSIKKFFNLDLHDFAACFTKTRNEN